MERKLPDGWEWKKLHEVAEISSGNGAPQGDAFFEGGKYPFVRTFDVGAVRTSSNLTSCRDRINDKAIEENRMKLFPAKTLLIPKSGASTFLNHRALLGMNAYVSSHLATVIPYETVMPKYLYYWSLTLDAKTLTHDVNYPSLGLAELGLADIPVPPLDTQRKIITILDKAEETKRLRAQANELAQKLLQSVFLDMFGDPSNNSKNWPIVKIKDVITGTQYGTSGKSSGNQYGYPILGMNNILDNGDLDLSRTNFIEMNDEDLDKYRLEPGDLLFNRTNAAIHVGKTGLFSEESNYVFASYLVRIMVNREKIAPAFLWTYLNSRFMRKKFTSMCKKAVNQANINPTELGNLSIYLPPIHLQEQFSQIIQELTVLKGQEIKSMETEESLYNALIAKAFIGKLVA